MLLSALLESQLEIFAQQCAIDIAHVGAHGVDLRTSRLHENQTNTAGRIWPRAESPASGPNALRGTIQISHGSNFRFGDETSAVASALVLWSHAQTHLDLTPAKI